MKFLGMHCDSETESRDMEVKVLVAQSMLDSLQPHGLCPKRLIHSGEAAYLPAAAPAPTGEPEEQS